MPERHGHGGQAAPPALQWFVLTHLEPARAEEALRRENALRLAGKEEPLEYFIPYRFLRHRTARPTVEEGTGTADEAGVPGLRSQENVDGANQTREALRRFVFLHAAANTVAALVAGERNRTARLQLHYYRDRAGEPVTVPEPMMGKFIAACCEHRYRFEIAPPLEGMERSERVVIASGPFCGEEAAVVAVRRTKAGIALELAVELFARTVTVRIPDVRPGDVIRKRGAEGTAGWVAKAPVEEAQRKLLDILHRRVRGKDGEGMDGRDMATLDRLCAYRALEMPTEASATHLLALMLICACLRHDARAVGELTEEAATALGRIEARGGAKAETDVRAYLHVALYAATGRPEYREAAKRHVQRNRPKSEALRHFVRLIRKDGFTVALAGR